MLRCSIKARDKSPQNNETGWSSAESCGTAVLDATIVGWWEFEEGTSTLSVK